MMRPTLEDEYKMALEAKDDEIERLRAALTTIAADHPWGSHAAKTARAALEEKK